MSLLIGPILDALLPESAGPGATSFVCDAAGRLIYASPGASELLGRRPSEIVGRVWGELGQRPEFVASFEACMQRAQTSGRAAEGTGRLVTPGGPRTCTLLVTPLRQAVDGMAAATLSLRPVDPPGPTRDACITDQACVLLREVVAGLTDVVFAKDLDGRYIWINAAGARVLGRPANEILGRTEEELRTDPETARATVRRDRQVLESGTSRTEETVDQTPLGSRTFQTTRWVHRDQAGRPRALVGVARDVTDALLREQALRLSEAQFRLLAENSTDMISRHDEAGRFLYVSPACRKLLGYEPQELIGQNAYEFVHPDDVAEVRSCHLRLLDSSECIAVTFRIRRRDGSETWVESITRTLRSALTGAVEEIQCSTRDISDRRRAEDELRSSRALLRAVLDNSTAVIYAKDTEGRYLLLNRWYEDVFGMTQDQLLGRTDHEIFPEPIADVFRANDLKILEEGHPQEFEETTQLADGVHTYLSVKCPIFGPEGTPVAVCGISTDITERKRFEEQLRLKNARLEEAIGSERRAHEALKRAESQMVQVEKLSSLGQMVAGVAHEINNPLAFVINNVAVLRRDLGHLATLLGLYREGGAVLAEARPDLYARIEELAGRIDLDYTLGALDDLAGRTTEGLDRIRRIVRDLRDFARPGEEGLHVADLNAGLTSTVNIVTGPARERGIELVVEQTPLPRVVCHSGRINQVLLNLLANAIDATPPGGTITVRSRSEPGGVVLDIIDTGRGIDRSIRNKIFDPFFTTKAVGKGTGLGLSISYGIVRAHGGRIEVESEPGQGARFSIHLPLEPPDARPQGI